MVENRTVGSTVIRRDAGSSRRRFIRGIAAGALGATAALKGVRTTSAADSEVGEVTLDALMITYLSAPLGSDGLAWYELGRAHTSTLRLMPTSAPELRLRANVPPGAEKLFEGAHFNQTESARVGGAITLEQRLGRGFHERFGARGDGPEDTGFLGMWRPRLRFKGTPDRLRFRLLGAAAEFIYSARDLRDASNTPSTIGSETARSFLAQYVTEPAALVAPRYEFRATDQPPFTLTELAGNEPPQRVTATVKATIVDQTGFESDGLKRVFAVGNTLDVVYSSVQEDASGKLMTLESTAETLFPVNEIYWDTVFKTFVILPPQG